MEVKKATLNVYREYKGTQLADVYFPFKVLIRLAKFWKTKV